MSIAADLLNRKEKPAYVKFVRESVEDIPASKAEGRYVARDIDIACITPSYSKDIMKFQVQEWFAQMQNDVRNERMPQEWADRYHAAYEAWKKGEELPLDGVPIKGWQVASPAQQDTLLRMGVLTVEDLAAINDEGIRRIGMGGVDLKNKAVAWLAAMKDKGQVVQENAALRMELGVLKGTVAHLEEKMKAFAATAQRPPEADLSPMVMPAGVVPSDRANLEAQYRAKFGRNPHPNSNAETLRARLA